jgi:hypothetical protein
MRPKRNRSNPRSLLQTIRAIAGLIILGYVIYQYVFNPQTAPPHSGPTSSSGPTVVNSSASPDPALTPGDVLTTNLSRICQSGYTQTVRNVPESLKVQVYRTYGITHHAPGEFEVDHLISLELGGSNSLRNLWPESFVTKPLNAHVKDELENKLHELICSHQLPVAQAQQEIAQDWQAAYQKYVGPLPRR